MESTEEIMYENQDSLHMTTDIAMEGAQFSLSMHSQGRNVESPLQPSI